MKNISIYYVTPYDSSLYFPILYNFFRISNYLNARKEKLPGDILEEYIDLRFEKFPPFNRENLPDYLEHLEKFFEKLLFQVELPIIALSCYSSYCYLNTIYIAYIIKKLCPNSLIVVGGVHPSIFPEEFQPSGIPGFIHERFSENTTPIDYIIQYEGEQTFFELIKQCCNNKLTFRNNLKTPCRILTNKELIDLDKVPLIDLTLAEKYKEDIASHNHLYIDFFRGCPNRCKFCIGSLNIPCYNKIRSKKIEKCIKELELINRIDWLHIDYLDICDPIFLPIRSFKREFFEKFSELKKNNGFHLKLQVFERIDTCSLSDLEYYKQLDINPLIGVESFSRNLLEKIGKLNLLNERFKNKHLLGYLNKTREIIKKVAEIDLNAVFYYIVGVPGVTKETLDEDYEFLFGKDESGKSLAEDFKFIIQFFKYSSYPSADFYLEPSYGSLIHFPDWWKQFDGEPSLRNKMVTPSNEIGFLDMMRVTSKLIDKFFKAQRKLNNPKYNNNYLFKIKMIERALSDKFKEYNLAMEVDKKT